MAGNGGESECFGDPIIQDGDGRIQDADSIQRSGTQIVSKGVGKGGSWNNHAGWLHVRGRSFLRLRTGQGDYFL